MPPVCISLPKAQRKLSHCRQRCTSVGCRYAGCHSHYRYLQYNRPRVRQNTRHYSNHRCRRISGSFPDSGFGCFCHIQPGSRIICTKCGYFRIIVQAQRKRICNPDHNKNKRIYGRNIYRLRDGFQRPNNGFCNN